MITPHDYQEKAIRDIIEKFRTKERVLLQMATGSGKTVVFSLLSKTVVTQAKKKVVILCHREELISQTVATMESLGLVCQSVYPSTKRILEQVDCYVCMVETVYNRLKKDRFKFENIGLLIADECHIRVFDKVYDFFPTTKILGVTATPI